MGRNAPIRRCDALSERSANFIHFERGNMPSLLAIESSPRGDYSISRKLTGKFIEEWKAAHAGGAVVVRDLAKTDLPFVDLPWIA